MHAPQVGGCRVRAPGDRHGGQLVEEGGPGPAELLPRVWGAHQEWNWSNMSSTGPWDRGLEDDSNKDGAALPQTIVGRRTTSQ